MTTSKERVAELANWYNNKKARSHPPSMPNDLPTWKRQLDEIEYSVGFLSNITVRVIHVRSEPTGEINTYRYGQTKRKNRDIAFASFTDDSEVIMPFIDLSGRFLPQLKSAQNKNNTMRLVMTNVSTEYRSSLLGLSTSSEEIVLVPTETTTGRLISRKERSNQLNTKSNSFNDFNATEIQERTRASITMLSSITDICINGLFFKSNSSIFSSSLEFLRTVTGNDGNFNRATIYLENSDEQVSKTGILATPNVLKVLCGSLDVAELSNNKRLCMYSMRFLQDLLHEHIILNCTLNKDSYKTMKVVNVSLHHMPEQIIAYKEMKRTRKESR